MSAVDRHQNIAPSKLGSLRFAEVVDGGSDTEELDHVSTAIMAAGAGNIHAITVENDEVTFPVLAGILYPIRLKKVFETDTTATGIIAWDN